MSIGKRVEPCYKGVFAHPPKRGNNTKYTNLIMDEVPPHTHQLKKTNQLPKEKMCFFVTSWGPTTHPSS